MLTATRRSTINSNSTINSSTYSRNNITWYSTYRMIHVEQASTLIDNYSGGASILNATNAWTSWAVKWEYVSTDTDWMPPEISEVRTCRISRRRENFPLIGIVEYRTNMLLSALTHSSNFIAPAYPNDDYSNQYWVEIQVWRKVTSKFYDGDLCTW